MTSILPSPEKLADTAKELAGIEPQTKAQSQALADAIQLVQALAGAPAALEQARTQLTAAYQVQNVGSKERMISVISRRLKSIHNTVMAHFEERESNPHLRAAYLEFAKDTLTAFRAPRLNFHDDEKSMARLSQERLEIYNKAESNIVKVREALQYNMGRLPSRSPLQLVALEIHEVGNSDEALCSHIERVVDVLTNFQPEPTKATHENKRRIKMS